MYDNITGVSLAPEGLVINVDPPQVPITFYILFYFTNFNLQKTLKVLEGSKKTILLKIDDQSVAMTLYLLLTNIFLNFF